MELVNFPGIVRQLDGLKPNIFELIQPAKFRNVCVET